MLEFGGYRLDLAGHSLTNRAGREVPLTPREFCLLRAFAQKAGRVLSRDQLLQLTAGRDGKSYDRSIDMQILRLRRKIELDVKRPSLIVTVPGSGYKFASKVREAKPDKHTSQDGNLAIANGAGTGSPAVIAKNFAASRLSFVVLPFDNLGGDPEQDYFADGATESLTTDLSRIHNSFVIARNTAFAYKSRRMDVRAIGRELNVRYVIEGSVQRSGDRMRVSAQLIEAESGGHVWAERFDQPVAELFDLQDAIVARIAAMLNTQVVAAEARWAERRPTPNSMDLYFQGMAWLSRGVKSREHGSCASFSRARAGARPRKCLRDRRSSRHGRVDLRGSR